MKLNRFMFIFCKVCMWISLAAAVIFLIIDDIPKAFIYITIAILEDLQSKWYKYKQ